MDDQPVPKLRTRLREARVGQVLAVYLPGCFVAIQVIDIFVDRLGLPDWFFTGTLVLMGAGGIVVLATALARGRFRFARRLTWRRTALAGAGAFVLLVLAVAGYMAMRSLGIGPIGSLVAAGVLDARDPVIIADFDTRTGDPVLAEIATEAFRVDLAQSPIITIVSPSYVRGVLERMGREGIGRLDEDLAREAAIREGIKAVVAGEIARAGGGYLLTAKLVSAESGEVIAAMRSTAADSTQLLSAIDDLSKRLRERVGESLRTIRSNEPLERVTTGSLEALRRYTQAVRVLDQGDYARGVALLREATALDTTFAMAWRKLGAALGNQQEQAQAIEAYAAAYRHRDRLTDRERYHTDGSYFSSIGQPQQAIVAYRTLLDQYPNDAWALNNLANIYSQLGDLERAEEMLRRAVDGEPSPVAFGNLIGVRMELGKSAAADSTLEAMSRRMPGNPAILQNAFKLAAARFDYDRAGELARDLRDRHVGDAHWTTIAGQALAGIHLVRGRLSAADAQITEVVERMPASAAEAARTNLEATRALIDIWIRRSPAAGIVRLEAVERETRGRDPIGRPYFGLANGFAMAGRPERALDLLDEFERVADDADRWRFRPAVRVAELVIAVAEERYRDVVDAGLEPVDPGACRICALPLVGVAYAELGVRDSAILALRRYIELPAAERFDSDVIMLPFAYERLAELYDAQGDVANARTFYARFAELWADADAELRPRVERARRRLAELGRDRPAG